MQVCVTANTTNINVTEEHLDCASVKLWIFNLSYLIYFIMDNGDYLLFSNHGSYKVTQAIRITA